MKFIKIAAALTLLTVLFLSLGGYMLFDFRHNFYLAALSCGVILSLAVYVFIRQDDRIEALEKKIREIEEMTEEDKGT